MPRTLREIAAAANVSVSITSRALNGHPAISPETVTRVHQVAEELRSAGPTARSGGCRMNHVEVTLENGAVANLVFIDLTVR